MSMNCSTASVLPLPAPDGVSLTSVTSDGCRLYALQPDRRTVYQLDSCGMIRCKYATCRKYTSLHYENGRFYAPAEGAYGRLFILDRCLREIGSLTPDLLSEEVNENRPCVCADEYGPLHVGPAGSCAEDENDRFAVANDTVSILTDSCGRVSYRLGNAGRGRRYTAVAVNDGVRYEGLEGMRDDRTYIRAVTGRGNSRLQRLPSGVVVRSFFCFCGRLHAYLTRNGYHGFILPVCPTFGPAGVLGDILDLGEENDRDEDCSDRLCRSSCRGSCSGCASACSCGVSTDQSDFCRTAVSGDSVDSCDLSELCRIWNCLQTLCAGTDTESCNCGGIPSCDCRCGGPCLPLACPEDPMPVDVSADRSADAGVKDPPCRERGEGRETLGDMKIGDLLHLLCDLLEERGGRT